MADRLVAKVRFDGIADLAQYLPVAIVSNAVGLPEEGREKMLEWSEGNFDCIGPMNERAQRSVPALQDMRHSATTHAVRGKLKPGNWAEAFRDAAGRREMPK